MTSDLLPCPFCGGTPFEDQDVRGDWYFVVCEDCLGSGGDHRTAREAIAAWNRRAAPPAETGAKGAVGDLLDAVGNALHLPDHPDVAKAFARVEFMHASPCSCWEEAMNRYRSGRAAWVGCSCLDHDPKERCDCPFCSLIHRGAPPAKTGESDVVAALNRYITTIEQAGGKIALGAGVLVDLHNDIADARAAIVRMYRQALATPVDPPTGECGGCGGTGEIVPGPIVPGLTPCPDCSGDGEGEDLGEVVITSLGDGAEYHITASDDGEAARINAAFEAMLAGGLIVPVPDPTGDAPGGETDG